MPMQEINADPIYLALTRPPLAFGVPMDFFGINFIITGMAIVLCSTIFAMIKVLLLFSLPMHALAVLATRHDPHWLDVWKVKLSKTGFTRNQHFWEANSYSP